MRLCFFRLPMGKLCPSMQQLLNESSDGSICGLRYWPAIIYNDYTEFIGQSTVGERCAYYISTTNKDLSSHKHSQVVRFLGWSGRGCNDTEESRSEYMYADISYDDPNDDRVTSFAGNRAAFENEARDFLQQSTILLFQRQHVGKFLKAMAPALEYHNDPNHRTNLDANVPTSVNVPSPHNDMVSDPEDTVESLVSLVSWSSPDSQVKTSGLNGKSRRKKTSARRRRKSKKSGSGSRLVWNEATHNAPKSCNDRTCLVDSVCSLLTGPECFKAKVHEAMLSVMPRSGDTSIASINDALEPFNMDLVPVTHLYNQPGGLPYHILQQQHCKLVIRIKLSNLKNQTVYHSVGWDGSIIHDHPKMCIVNRTKDRRYWDDSNAVFDRLYPKKFFMGWQIATVYRLRLID